MSSQVDRAAEWRRARGRSLPRWLTWPMVTGVMSLGLLLALAIGVMTAQTKDGVIVVENVPAGGVVELDGAKVRMGAVNGPSLRIAARPGEHAVIVKRGEELLLGESVVVESGKAVRLRTQDSGKGRAARAEKRPPERDG